MDSLDLGHWPWGHSELLCFLSFQALKQAVFKASEVDLRRGHHKIACLKLKAFQEIRTHSELKNTIHS